ncbi:MAG TPA: gamma-glutamyltransferase [Planctomycetaceae bacterium]|nr:gamma-glutamyltransferase [Planctomycetaceae bacterium]
MRRAGLFLAVLVLGGANMSADLSAADERAIGGYDRPAQHPKQSRSETVAVHGIVATSQPLAAQVGLDVLKSGGNAADAAIAASAMMGLVEPMSCGIGGDLFVIYWDAKTQKLYGLNASGRSPYGLTREIVQQRGLKELPETGPLSWSVPGCDDGWEQLRAKFGTRPLAELLQPAIAHAEEGFAVTEIIARGWGSSGLREWPDSVRTYLPGGRAPRTGEIFRNPDLAASYRLIAEHGPAAFYTGDIAKQIVAFSEANGGYFSLRDFADHRSEWVDPVSTNYRGYDVWELPPNGQGIAALEMLNLLEGYDLRALGAFSPEYLHLLIEAKKLAFADRAAFYADMAFERVPVSQLISKEYANRQRKRINPDRAATDVPPGDPKLGHGDTIYMSVVDKDRNCCSFIQSNYFGYGSQVVPGKVGFCLQNRGTLFSLDAHHPNRLEPHKRPFHTIIPAFVTREGKPWFCFGVMGGDMQPQGHVQVLVNMIDFGMNVQAAGDAARLQHLGSATPTGRPMEAGGGTVTVESGFSDATVQALKAKGHRVVRGGGYGGYQGILIDAEHGTLHGGTDPRKDGCAIGY